VAKPTVIDITPNSSASHPIDRRAWRLTCISARYLRKRRREATPSIIERSARFALSHAYPSPRDNSSTSGSTYSRSFPRAARRYTQGGEMFRVQSITRYFARGRDPKRHGSAVHRRLTNRWSRRVADKVASSCIAARRSAQPLGAPDDRSPPISSECTRTAALEVV
jgi:hypothetical protein